MHQWIGSALVQIMTCCLLGAKPLSKPILGLLSTGSLGTKFSETFIKIQNFSFMKMHRKISSVKWRPFCPGEGQLKASKFYLLAYNIPFICNRPKFCFPSIKKETSLLQFSLLQWCELSMEASQIIGKFTVCSTAWSIKKKVNKAPPY